MHFAKLQEGCRIAQKEQKPTSLDHLKNAFLSALDVDWDWLLTKLPENILIVIAKHWNSGQETEGVYILPDTNILLVHPPLSNTQIGCFHAKLMLLFFDGWMRVVVASGILIPYDWETNENVIFVQDFPIVQATGIKNHIVNKLSQYDFSRAKAKLIASIPGAYKGIENMKKYGHGSLCKVVQEVCGPNENLIRMSTYLTSLYLKNVDLNPARGEALAEALHRNTTLNHLDLSSDAEDLMNNLKSEGGTMLSL
ncbi:hypothetical protein C2G38_2248309 [Gigaspora rosea]|uniref:Uncharacterized protein n=1 Tax=Gigaspora rosea TaxID=44941 RepID=A0A397UVN8_9GLOM|nr:hypothetical protein C2G38_2248309 [Gigaspora rosea]